ncbi:hypothetical protein MUK42_14305 [Musa troglodytarum]|uniref:Uncharacterized protein n=1 Tax=Musa troglodytarum TaxID=320322 RepID=A0A9E7GJX7_9LILI|nr:hypothetical protein MUK42_14305 [Musa troglodytarum]
MHHCLKLPTIVDNGRTDPMHLQSNQEIKEEPSVLERHLLQVPRIGSAETTASARRSSLEASREITRATGVATCQKTSPWSSTCHRPRPESMEAPVSLSAFMVLGDLHCAAACHLR